MCNLDLNMMNWYLFDIVCFAIYIKQQEKHTPHTQIYTVLNEIKQQTTKYIDT